MIIYKEHGVEIDVTEWIDFLKEVFHIEKGNHMCGKTIITGKMMRNMLIEKFGTLERKVLYSLCRFVFDEIGKE